MNRREPHRRSPASDDEQWLEIPGICLSQEGVIRLRGPRGADLSQILQSLRDGSYARPFVHDDGICRRLHFDFRSVQSEMLINDPARLTFAYTRKMMAFLLFAPNPRHVVIVGLGGGSLTRFCHRELPEAHITTVEVDEDVIALSELFRLPVPDRRTSLVHADAADYFAMTNQAADVVLIDGCDRWGTAPAFCEPSFYENLRARLRPDGLLVVNLIGPNHRTRAIRRIISDTFSNRGLLLNITAGGNRLLFAFNDPDKTVDWPGVRHLAADLAVRHGIDFPDFVRRMQGGTGFRPRPACC